MRTGTKFPTGILVVAAVFGAGCTGDDDDDDATEATVSPETTTGETGPVGTSTTAAPTSPPTSTEAPTTAPTTAAPDTTAAPGTTGAPGTTEAAEPANVVVTAVRFTRVPADDVSCSIEIDLFNNGPGRADDIRVETMIENLRGAGAPDHVTIDASPDGPDVIEAGEEVTYGGRLGVAMQVGDVWLYEGTVSVRGEQTYAFSSPSRVPTPCE